MGWVRFISLWHEQSIAHRGETHSTVQIDHLSHRSSSHHSSTACASLKIRRSACLHRDPSPAYSDCRCLGIRLPSRIMFSMRSSKSFFGVAPSSPIQVKRHLQGCQAWEMNCELSSGPIEQGEICIDLTVLKSLVPRFSSKPVDIQTSTPKTLTNIIRVTSNYQKHTKTPLKPCQNIPFNSQTTHPPKHPNPFCPTGCRLSDFFNFSKSKRSAALAQPGSSSTPSALSCSSLAKAKTVPRPQKGSMTSWTSLDFLRIRCFGEKMSLLKREHV